MVVKKLIYEGYVYVKQNLLANGVVSYECELRRNRAECKAKIQVAGRNTVSYRVVKPLISFHFLTG